MAAFENSKTICQSTGIGAAEDSARSERVAALQEVAGNVAMLVVCSGKEEKVQTYTELMSHFTGRPMEPGSEVVIWNRSGFKEPESDNPVLVARSKVNQARLHPAEREELDIPENYAVIAGDITAYAQNAEGELMISHQLSRLNRPLTPEEFNLVRQMLIRRYYTMPKEKGVGKIMYETGTYIRNGSEAGFGDKLEITFGPIDIELLDRYFASAVENGLIYFSNMQMEAIECLIESGAILSISILPRELELQGFTLDDMRRAPTPNLLMKVWETVVSNIPPHNY